MLEYPPLREFQNIYGGVQPHRGEAQFRTHSYGWFILLKYGNNKKARWRFPFCHGGTHNSHHLL